MDCFFDWKLKAEYVRKLRLVGFDDCRTDNDWNEIVYRIYHLVENKLQPQPFADVVIQDKPPSSNLKLKERRSRCTNWHRPRLRCDRFWRLGRYSFRWEHILRPRLFRVRYCFGIGGVTRLKKILFWEKYRSTICGIGRMNQRQMGTVHIFGFEMTKLKWNAMRFETLVFRDCGESLGRLKFWKHWKVLLLSIISHAIRSRIDFLSDFNSLCFRRVY